MGDARLAVSIFLRILLAACVCVAPAGCAFSRRAADPSKTARDEDRRENGSARVIVTVSGFRNGVGVARAALFRSADGFPNDSEKAFRRAAVPIRGHAAKFVFDDVPSGVYTLAVLHDENENGVQDTNAAGIPTEGYGASNNPAALFRPPSFDSARFAVHPPETAVFITLRYVL